MATMTVTFALDDDEVLQLRGEAAGQSATVEALVERWVRERLLHEREKALGIKHDSRSPRP